MADPAISPGPFPSNAPEPTQIDCIAVEKVYASCSQTVNATLTLAEDGCLPPYSCTINLGASSCTVGAITPSTTPDISNITFVITVVMEITCGNNASFSKAVYTTVTVPLYHPGGTTAKCQILSGTCSVVALPNHHISASATLCLLLQTTAKVQLLVPTYGFCVPAPCDAPALPDCPPSGVFPPQKA